MVMKVNAGTYEEYLLLMKGNTCKELLKKKEIIVSNFRSAQQIHSKFHPFTYLIDYSTGKYLFVEKTCFDLFGYTKQYLLKIGHSGYFSKIHSKDHDVLTNVEFKDLVKFLNHIPLDKYGDYVFSFNYRFPDAVGEYRIFMQRHSYIQGNDMGNPSGAVGMVYDISHFKNDSTIVCTIEEMIPENNSVVSNLVFKKVYPVKQDIPILPISKREKEILNGIATGLSTKQIARSLTISINTVNNHRKNMLHKTNCKNLSELIKQACKQRLL
jgi:DNA-binding CsgD family transcriptional regulator